MKETDFLNKLYSDYGLSRDDVHIDSRFKIIKRSGIEKIIGLEEITINYKWIVKDPAHLDKANPFSPVMPMNSATIVSQLTADKPGKKLGVVLKPCEIRALIELVKLGQMSES